MDGCFFCVGLCWVCYTIFWYFCFLPGWFLAQILFTFCPEKQETCTSLHPYARNNLCSLGTGKHLETTYGSAVHGLLNCTVASSDSRHKMTYQPSTMMYTVYISINLYYDILHTYMFTNTIVTIHIHLRSPLIALHFQTNLLWVHSTASLVCKGSSSRMPSVPLWNDISPGDSGDRWELLFW